MKHSTWSTEFPPIAPFKEVQIGKTVRHKADEKFIELRNATIVSKAALEYLIPMHFEISTSLKQHVTESTVQLNLTKLHKRTKAIM